MTLYRVPARERTHGAEWRDRPSRPCVTALIVRYGRTWEASVVVNGAYRCLGEFSDMDLAKAAVEALDYHLN